MKGKTYGKKWEIVPDYEDGNWWLIVKGQKTKINSIEGVAILEESRRCQEVEQWHLEEAMRGLL